MRTDSAAVRRAPLRHWPVGLGLVVAGGALVAGADRMGTAITVSVAAVCYLAAATFQRPWTGWAAIPGAVAAIMLGALAGLPWWASLGVAAAALTGAGLLRPGRRRVTAQALAALAFGGCAVLAVLIAGRAGLVLAGLALAAHAGWDLVHYRRAAVVPRSLSAACMALDLPLGAGVAVLGLIG